MHTEWQASRTPYHEIKYVVSRRTAERLGRYLQMELGGGPAFAQGRTRTTYYDDRELSCYFQARDGFREKTKYRLRRYLGEDGADYSLEIKRRDGTLTSKTKVLISGADEDLGRLPDFGAVVDAVSDDEPELRARFRGQLRSALRPAVVVSYDRRRFVDRNRRYRYSLDLNITCQAARSLPGQARSRVLFPMCVFEIKSDSATPRAEFLPRFELDPASFSKLAYGMDGLLGMEDRDGRYR